MTTVQKVEMPRKKYRSTEMKFLKWNESQIFVIMTSSADSLKTVYLLIFSGGGR